MNLEDEYDLTISHCKTIYGENYGLGMARMHIYQMCKENLALALTSPHVDIRAMSDFIVRKEGIEEEK